MFYIGKRTLLGRREALFLHIIPTAMVFLAFIGLTLANWSTAVRNNQTEQLKSLGQSNGDVANYIEQRTSIYEGILRGSAGLFNVSPNVSTGDWQKFIESHDIKDRYPGISAVGFSQVVRPNEKQNFVDTLKSLGHSDAQIFPSGDRDIYVSVKFMQTFTGSPASAFGYDMFSDGVRKKAMEYARDSGGSAVTEPITLLRDQTLENKQPGFIIFFPVYSGGSVPDQIDQRKNAIIGYTFASFRSYDLINESMIGQNGDYGFQIYTDVSSEPKLLYQSDNYQTLLETKNGQSLSSSVSLLGATWRITGASSPNIVDPNSRTRTTLSLWAGFLFSFVMAGFIYLLLANRARAISQKEERSIQEAKDELLALASHQLRTPATGVKQYVGMLRDGFAGELSPTQQRLLDKAYESNERQLATINEMLFVARSDAGHLKMEKDPVDLNTVLTDILGELENSIEQRGHLVVTRLPKQATYVLGDRQYLRMAIENIINNAIKYTKDGGRISIKLVVKENIARLSITDSGVGVSEEDKKMLFKKFSRIPNELTNKVSGSGIGLYLAKKVIDAHKGKIFFSSIPMKGSTVIIELPVRKHLTRQK